MSGSRPRPRRGAAALASAALSGSAARAAYASLRRRPPRGATLWDRTNHRGEPVTLLEGPAVAVAAVAASAVGPGLPARVRAALMIAGIGAAAFGGYDDLAGNGKRRGFHGHLGALAHGEVTTGTIKIGGIGATGLVSAATLGGAPADGVVNAGLVAGGANLLNLFDLRPGRALKVALAGGALLAAGGGREGGGSGPGGAQAVAAPFGAAVALLPEDLGERAMLGDAGANALGAMLGAAAAATLSRPARFALLAGIIGLTVASELVSFTAVIERTPALRRLDMLGRRPPAPSPAAQPAEASGRAAATGPAGGARSASGAQSSSAGQAVGREPTDHQHTGTRGTQPGSS